MEVPHRPLGYEVLARAAAAGGEGAAARSWADMGAAIAEPLDGLGSATAAALRARAIAYDDADAARAAADHAGPLDAARAWLLAGRLSGDADLLGRAHDALGAFGARRDRDEAAYELRALGKRVAPPAQRGGEFCLDISPLSNNLGTIAAGLGTTRERTEE